MSSLLSYGQGLLSEGISSDEQSKEGDKSPHDGNSARDDCVRSFLSLVTAERKVKRKKKSHFSRCSSRALLEALGAGSPGTSPITPTGSLARSFLGLTRASLSADVVFLAALHRLDEPPPPEGSDSTASFRAASGCSGEAAREAEVLMVEPPRAAPHFMAFTQLMLSAVDSREVCHAHNEHEQDICLEVKVVTILCFIFGVCAVS